LPKRETFGLKLKDSDSHRATVSEVAPESPAAKAGLQADDVITDVETKPVSNADAALDAIARSDGRAAKKGILLNIERKGKRTYAVLEPGE
jgi:S1-C subfamily serine protease